MLKKIEHTDLDGRKYLIELPEEFQDMPETGIIIGPPSLEMLNMPLDMEVELNNQLFDRKLFTWSDVRRRPEEIEAALKAVLKVDVRKIKELYMEVKND